MLFFSSIFLLLGLAPYAFAGYSLKDDYSADKFFDMFTFDTVSSPDLCNHPQTDAGVR